MSGIALHSRRRRHRSISIAARGLRSDDRRVRRAQPGAVVGVGRRRGRLDGEAGVAEDRGQRAPHLRIVVADEDP
jgi:hypothetical protein